MQLEIITQQPATNRGLTPLLFVHGACHGAWCWENFLPFFAERGYEAHALSLRGHGLSEGRERILGIPTSEYVEDVAAAVNRMSALPVLIGHSLGGYVVQKYLETRVARAAVLLASVPASGSLNMLLRLTIRHPWRMLKFHATRSAYSLVQTPTLAREALFSPALPPETLDRHFARLQDESYAWAWTLPSLICPGRIKSALSLCPCSFWALQMTHFLPRVKSKPRHRLTTRKRKFSRTWPTT